MYTGQKHAVEYYGSSRFDGTNLEKHPESFLLVGVSNYVNACEKINIGDTVAIEHETTNNFDKNAKRVHVNGNTLGYIPKKHKYYNNLPISMQLNVVDKRYHRDSYGIRVLSLEHFGNTNIKPEEIIHNPNNIGSSEKNQS